MAKNLLLVAYHFPPDPSIASNRSQGLACYLPQHGWNVTVVTARYPNRLIEDFNCPVVQVQDPGVMWAMRQRLSSWSKSKPVSYVSNEKKGNVGEIQRLGLRKWLYEILCFPDEQIGWYSPCLRKCRELVARCSFDVVLTSSYPVTSHLIGHTLKQTEMIRYWVADLRDLWTQNHYLSGRFSGLRASTERWLERYVLSTADLLVTVSAPMAQQLKKLHPKSKVEVVTNGLISQYSTAPTSSQQKFTIVYTGQLYSGRRDPSLLFETLRLMVSRGYLLPHEYEVRFIGDDSVRLQGLIRKYGLERNVVVSTTVSRDQARREQHNATVLLLVNWDHPAERGTYTGKLFEYLEVERPILAIGGPGGVQSELLSQTSAGYYVNSIPDLERVLSSWLAEFRQTGEVVFRGRPDQIQIYSWSQLAARYAALLECVSENHKGIL